MSSRPSPDVYFMSIAHEASKRATCPRRHVGCVLVRDGAPLATGYNGSMRTRPHCEDIGCLLIDNHCKRTIHAEVNAIDSAAREGARTRGATAYVTAFPCWECFKQLVNAGIVRIVYGSPYVDSAGDMVRLEAAALGLPLDELLGVVPPPAPADGAIAMTHAPGALHVGMSYDDVLDFDFGDCPGKPPCACHVCLIVESLMCACGTLYIDHVPDGVQGSGKGAIGCAGFSLASWRGGRSAAPAPAPPPKRTRKRKQKQTAPAS